MNEESSKIDNVKRAIQIDIWGCDLKLSLFLSALNSFRVDNCLRPSPNKLTENEDFNSIKKTCSAIPQLDKIEFTDDSIDILHWLFIEKHLPGLKRVSLNDLNLPDNQNLREIANKPKYAFEIVYSERQKILWKNRTNEREIITAFHGSHLENFHSILHVGLQVKFCIDKPLLCGEGIYLTSDLDLSTNFAPFGNTWNGSLLGSRLSIVALCEIINDGDKVKTSKNLSTVPNKYFVVTDSDCVRVKHLLVYKETTPLGRIAQEPFKYILTVYTMMIGLLAVFHNWKTIRFLFRKFF